MGIFSKSNGYQWDLSDQIPPNLVINGKKLMVDLAAQILLADQPSPHQTHPDIIRADLLIIPPSDRGGQGILIILG